MKAKMKTKIVACSLMVASTLFSADIDLKQFQDLTIIKQSHMIIKKAKNIGDDWYYLEALNRGSKIGVYTDKEKVIIGRGFYSETGEEIKFDIDTQKYKKNAPVTIGTGKEEFFLFTDPECPYCKMLDEKLSLDAVKDKMKLHTYLYPLEFHILANAMSVATLSQPKEKRGDYLSDLMKKETADVIKEVDKYTDIFYRDLLKAANNARYTKMIAKYAQGINAVYGTNLSDVDSIKSFCNSRIGEKKSLGQENELLNSLRATSEDFNVTGTPMMFDAKGNKVNNPFMVFAKLGIIDIASVKEIEKLGMVIQMGDKKKEKLYIFSSTKCPHCISSFKDEKIMKKLKNYNVQFVLMNTGSDPKLAQKIHDYLLQIQDEKKKLSEFKRIMNGGSVSQVELDKKASPFYRNKQALYMKYIIASMVQSTPLMVNEQGKVINNLK